MLSHSFRLTATDIDRAFEAGHFFVLYQPKVEVGSGRVLGVETFVRWRHPSFGLMPPGLFLSFVEHQGRMRELTELVLTLAVRAAREFRTNGKNWDVSVNLGGSDIADPRLPHLLKTLTGMQGVPAQAVTIEVPEYALPEPGTPGEVNLRNIRALGARVALDTGPVPPQKAPPIPAGLFEEIKIGGSAIIRFAHSTKGAGVSALSAKLRAARQIGLSAVAVGVEDEATWNALQDIGFVAAQGSFIQRAVTLQALLSWNGDWRDGGPIPASKADIDLAAMPEEVIGTRAPRPERPLDPKAPQTAAELLAAVALSTRAAAAADGPPLDLDADDESDVWDDEDAELLDEAPGEEPDGDPEIGSADLAPPLTSGLIDRPSARGVVLDPSEPPAAAPKAPAAPAAQPFPDLDSTPAAPRKPRFGSLFGRNAKG